jgi:hypothetical protein
LDLQPQAKELKSAKKKFLENIEGEKVPNKNCFNFSKIILKNGPQNWMMGVIIN